MALLPLSDELLRDARLFRGGQSLAERGDGLASGHAELDDALPWGGFPRGALTELLHAHDGIGELGLLLPALRQLLRDEPVVLINPPYLPYAPALRQAGLPLQRLIWIAPEPGRALWAAEQCLRSGCLGGVLLWDSTADERPLRRLQVAAETGRSLAWMFRPAKHACNPSPAALRLQVEPGRLRVLKCRGAVAPARPIELQRDYSQSMAIPTEPAVPLHEGSAHEDGAYESASCKDAADDSGRLIVFKRSQAGSLPKSLTDTAALPASNHATLHALG